MQFYIFGISSSKKSRGVIIPKPKFLYLYVDTISKSEGDASDTFLVIFEQKKINLKRYLVSECSVDVDNPVTPPNSRSLTILVELSKSGRVLAGGHPPFHRPHK